MTGFIYIVASVVSGYRQKFFCSVPTYYEGCLYFGPCKRSMRPRIEEGDYLFGVSPGGLKPRRILFATQVEKKMTFAKAYEKFPDLRGPEGTIHVKPVKRLRESFPFCDYEHISGSLHEDEWVKDLATRELDRFFVCSDGDGWFGRWLGNDGPEIDEEILAFLKTCAVYGNAGLLSRANNNATVDKPICHGKLYTGLHLETDDPEKLMNICAERMDGVDFENTVPEVPKKVKFSGACTTSHPKPERAPKRCC